MTCIMLTCDSPESSSAYRRFPAAAEEGVSSSSSSGRTAMNQTAMGEEVRSEYKGGPLDRVDALEKVFL